jgi:hypothetical protein
MYRSTLFLDLGTRRGWSVSVTPRPLSTHGKDPVPIVQEAGWAPAPVWTGVENLAYTGIRSPDHPARSQSLYRLSYPAHTPTRYLPQISFPSLPVPVPSCNHCCSGKSIIITYSEYVFATLGIRNAMRMRRIVICDQSEYTFFSPLYLINGTIFGKKLLSTKCAFWFSPQLLSETFLILRINDRVMIKKMYTGLHVKYPLFL